MRCTWHALHLGLVPLMEGFCCKLSWDFCGLHGQLDWCIEAGTVPLDTVSVLCLRVNFASALK